MKQRLIVTLTTQIHRIQTKVSFNRHIIKYQQSQIQANTNSLICDHSSPVQQARTCQFCWAQAIQSQSVLLKLSYELSIQEINKYERDSLKKCLSWLNINKSQQLFLFLTLFCNLQQFQPLYQNTAIMFQLHQDEFCSLLIEPDEPSIKLIQHAQYPKTNQNIIEMYYEQYKKIYLTSYKLYSEANKQIYLIKSLKKKITQIQGALNALDKRKRLEESEDICPNTSRNEQNKSIKRNRRTAEKIIRQFVCPFQRCDKSYGSDGSLQQHFKLKHPQYLMLEQQKNATS